MLPREVAAATVAVVTAEAMVVDTAAVMVVECILAAAMAAGISAMRILAADAISAAGRSRIGVSAAVTLSPPTISDPAR